MITGKVVSFCGAFGSSYLLTRERDHALMSWQNKTLARFALPLRLMISFFFHGWGGKKAGWNGASRLASKGDEWLPQSHSSSAVPLVFSGVGSPPRATGKTQRRQFVVAAVVVPVECDATAHPALCHWRSIILGFHFILDRGHSELSGRVWSGLLARSSWQNGKWQLAVGVIGNHSFAVSYPSTQSSQKLMVRWSMVDMVGWQMLPSMFR